MINTDNTGTDYERVKVPPFKSNT